MWTQVQSWEERGRRVACKQQEEEEDPEAGGRDSWKPFS